MTKLFYLFVLADDQDAKVEIEKLCSRMLDSAVIGDEGSDVSTPFGSLGPYSSRDEAIRSREQIIESCRPDFASHPKAWNTEQLKSARLIRIDVLITAKTEDV
jgi:hypothetical protein